ncbi:MAG: DUF1223 domain-containing protein [Polyangiaceae bacterium]
MLAFGVLVTAVLPGCSRELPAEGIVLATPEPGRERSARPDPSAPAAARVPTLSGTPSVSSATRGGEGVAVVELFTSEGCSSCPPADTVLANLTARANASSLPVYTLSFHVDYWNYLGWRDRFSSSSYSERQQAYSGISANGGTYTPQVVVNGAAECIGSDSSRIDALIDSALKRQSRTQIELDARRSAQGVEVAYRVSGDTNGRVLNLALLEPRAESQVEHGENAGERLTHVNVVRVFTSRKLSDGTAGHWTLPAGPDFTARRVGVVAFAEDASQRDVSGATALELP